MQNGNSEYRHDFNRKACILEDPCFLTLNPNVFQGYPVDVNCLEERLEHLPKWIHPVSATLAKLSRLKGLGHYDYFPHTCVPLNLDPILLLTPMSKVCIFQPRCMPIYII